MPNTKDWDHHKHPSLQGIAKRAKHQPDHRFRDLSRCLDEGLLRVAFKQLNRNAAPGVDKVTVAQYQEQLEDNIADLVQRLKQGRYRAKLIRRKHIPKSPGKTRALGIPVLEDKLLQTAVALLLSSIYEQDFHDFSYGYRPKAGARRAVDDLTVRMQFGRFGYVVEADIRGFFDHIDHTQLLDMISRRVDDKRFIRLINKWLKAGILEEDNIITQPDTGTPQGGVVSPVLANIYLHYVLDDWFEQQVKPHCQGDAILCRYADDFVCAFQYREDAHRFYRVLPKRLGTYNLRLAQDKTRLLRFSRFHPGKAHRFVFLSFEFYWDRDKEGKPRLFRRTARERLQRAKRVITDYIKGNRHKPLKLVMKSLCRKIQGHYNYFGVIGNLDALHHIYRHVVERLYKWLNRRSQRVSFCWEKFHHILEQWPLPYPKVVYVPVKDKVWW